MLQGGEDTLYTDAILCELIRSVKERCPGCAVTLSLGERSRESYEQLFAAGADRYLLRHETADPVHYASFTRLCRRSKTACAACAICVRSAIRWAAASWSAPRTKQTTVSPPI